jgi:hypothetical protein
MDVAIPVLRQVALQAILALGFEPEEADCILQVNMQYDASVNTGNGTGWVNGLMHAQGSTTTQSTPICAMVQVLMWAQLRGNSQNLVKVVSGGLPRAINERPPAIVHDTTLSARIDGGNTFGMLVMRLAVETALRKACAGGGMAIVGTSNTASGTGALG